MEKKTMHSMTPVVSLRETTFPPVKAINYAGYWSTFIGYSQILSKLRVREEADQIQVAGLDESIRCFLKTVGGSYCDREDNEVEPDDLDEEIVRRVSLFKSLEDTSPPISPNETSDDSDNKPDELGYRTVLGECWGEIFELLYRYLLSMSEFFIYGYLSPIVGIIHKAPTIVPMPLAETDDESGWLPLEAYVEHWHP